MEMVLLNEPLLLAGSDKASGAFGYYSDSYWNKFQLNFDDLD